MSNGVADGVIDKSSAKFDAKIQAVSHVAETIEGDFSTMLKLVTLGLVCHNFFPILLVWSIVVNKYARRAAVRLHRK